MIGEDVAREAQRRTEPTFTARPVVLVRIEGEIRGGDECLLARFYAWQMREQVFAISNVASSVRDWQGAFTPEDAERVIAWLRGEGVGDVSVC